MKRNETNMAEFAVKGALTRLALFFSSRRDERFSGDEIARILLETWHAYEKAKRAESEASIVKEMAYRAAESVNHILSDPQNREILAAELSHCATDGGC